MISSCNAGEHAPVPLLIIMVLIDEEVPVSQALVFGGEVESGG